MNDIKMGQGCAISAAFEAGITTVWQHSGYRFELEGIDHETETGQLKLMPECLDQMPISFEVDSVVCSNGKLRLNLVPSLTMELYLLPEWEKETIE